MIILLFLVHEWMRLHKSGSWRGDVSPNQLSVRTNYHLPKIQIKKEISWWIAKIKILKKRKEECISGGWKRGSKCTMTNWLATFLSLNTKFPSNQLYGASLIQRFHVVVIVVTYASICANYGWISWSEPVGKSLHKTEWHVPVLPSSIYLDGIFSF